jgi:hypothetical protein
MPDPIILTREELYNRVWQTPISTLAAELALSDVGLAKVCARYDIPTPPRGYWAKVKAGMKPRQAKLPRRDGSEELKLRFGQPSEPSNADEFSRAMESEASPENEIVVPDRLRDPCALVLGAKAALEAAKTDHVGLLETKKACLAIRVSPAQLSRALRIADALLKGLEARGWGVVIRDDKTLVQVAGIPMSLSIQEALATVELPVKPKVGTGDYSFNYNRRGETEQKPSGDLAISIQEQEQIWGHTIRRNWHDSEKRPLEAQLNKVVLGMVKLAGIVQVHREKKAQQAREEEERRRKLEHAEQEQKRLRAELAAEKERVDLLRSQAGRWHESQELRAFVARASELGALPEMGLEGQALLDWCDWALQQADRLDPFSPSPPSILDEAERIERMVASIRGYW